MSSKHEKPSKFTVPKFAIWIIKIITVCIYSSLVASVGSCIIRNSWILIWVSLEINTLSFCSIMKNYSKTKIAELSIKYFVIQSVSSVLLVRGMTVSKSPKLTITFLVFLPLLSLLVKIAASPFQEWFVSITKNSKPSPALILITWQKLAPLFLLLYQAKPIIWPFLFLSIILGSVIQINRVNFLEILAYSSVFNLSWIMISVIISNTIFIMFCVIYWVSVFIVVLYMKNSKQKKINTSPNTRKEKLILLIIIANLAGLPPLSGFLAKWMLIKEFAVSNTLFIISAGLILRSINFFVYTRAVSKVILKNAVQFQISTKQITKTNITLFIIYMIFPIPLIFLLGHAWNKGLCW
jgi:NADH:ubiquinone oxidoreductase subunit 2 (subunit N)